MIKTSHVVNVPCPQNLKTHMTRSHKDALFARVQERYKLIEIPKSMNENIPFAGDSMEWNDSSYVIDCDAAASNEFIFDPFEIENKMINLYQTTYLKYNSVNLIPRYVCDGIMDDIQGFINLNTRNIIDCIETFSKNLPELKQFAQQIIDHIEVASVYEKVHKKNHTDLAKLTWKKETKMYVEPRQIDLEDNDKFHFVPLLDNLKALLVNPDIYKAFFTKKSRNLLF